jgi:hypothetical protein
MMKKLSAEEFAAKLAEIQKLSVCEDCDVLRGANLCAIKHYGSGKGGLFQKNLTELLTTHVDLGCNPCPVDRLMKSLSKDRLAAVAAIF